MGDDWEYQRIEDVAEKVGMGPFGSSIKVSTFVSEGVPIISGQHLHESRLQDGEYNFITPEHAQRLKNSNVFRGDIIFTHAGNIGQAAYIPDTSRYERYVISQRQFYMRCDKTKVIPAFVTYYFKTAEGQHNLLANSSPSGVPSIAQPVTYLRSLEIPVPPLKEQQAIACILGTLDDKIELNRRMNQTLEGMARAIFKSWFVDFDPVWAKVAGEQPAGLAPHIADLFPDAFEASELGEIPKGWQVCTVSELARINEQSLGKGDPLDLIDYVEINKVMRGEISEIVRYERGTEPSRARRRLRHGDTVLSTVRPDRGAHFLCLDPPEALIASTGFAVLSPKDGCWAFLYTALTRTEIGETLGRLADGGAYPAIRSEVVGNLTIAIPGDPELVQEFERTAEPLYQKAARNRDQCRTLAALRDTLLPKLTSGELRVPDVEQMMEKNL